MVTGHKGRGGKKPRYQIADIGGSDLTAQDISTERVLNFLIRGEINPDDQVDPSQGTRTSNTDPSSFEHTSTPEIDIPVEAATLATSTPPPPKKRLDDLFARASSGKSVSTPREPKLQTFVVEQTSLPSHAVAQTEFPSDLASHKGATSKEIETIENVSLNLIQESSLRQTAPPSTTSLRVGQNIAFEATEHQVLTTEADLPAFDLDHYIQLWKTFYRLKDGEIEALSTLFRMSHVQGTQECYVKMQKLAAASNLTYRYCQKVVRSLEQLGWITKLKDYNPSNQLGVLYRVNLKPSMTIF